MSHACALCGAASQVVHSQLHDGRHGYPGFFAILRCTACGYGRTHPAPSRADLAALYRYYPRATLTPERVRETFEGKRSRTMLRQWWEGAGTECVLYVRKGGRVLDVGCGDCSSLLMARALGAAEVVGIEVDASLGMIAAALGLDLHIGQLRDLPATRGQFDFVLGRQVLEHDPEPMTLLAEMKSRLRPGGRIVLSFPNVDAWSRRRYGALWLHWHVPFHINHFSRRSIDVLARGCGLRIERIGTVTPNAWTAYQRRFAAVAMAPGQRDPFWDPAPPGAVPAPPPRARWASRWVGGVRAARDVARSRFIDACGAGDSWIVALAA